MITVTGVALENFSYKRENLYTVPVGIKRTSGVEDVLYLTIPYKIDEDIKGKLISSVGEIHTKNKNRHLELYVSADTFDVLSEVPEDYIGENSVHLFGTICMNNHLRSTPMGREITDFSLAINHMDGTSSYIPCLAWGRNAEIIDECKVGTKLEVYGRLQSRAYVRSDGFERTVYEVSVQKFVRFE